MTGASGMRGSETGAVARHGEAVETVDDVQSVESVEGAELVDVTGTLSAQPHPDAVAAVRACASAQWEREGVAMFVTLHDARPGRAAAVTDERALVEGARLRELFDRYHGELAAAGHPLVSEYLAETGAPEVITTLVVLSDRHLAAGVGV